MEKGKSWWLCLVLLITVMSMMQNVHALNDDDDVVQDEDNVTTQEPANEISENVQSESKLTSFLMSMDLSFVEAYSSPFITELQDAVAMPPVVVYTQGSVDPAYKSGVVVPEHTNYATFNFWVSENDSLQPYQNGQASMTVKSFPNTILENVQVKLDKKQTTIVQVHFQCKESGEAPVVLTIAEESSGVEFDVTLKKQCRVSNTDGLWVLTPSGQAVFGGGEADPAFNIHDLRKEPHVSSIAQSEDEFVFHTNGRHFILKGRPTVQVFKPTESILNWLSSSREDLARSIQAFKLEQESGEMEEDDEEVEEIEAEIEEVENEMDASQATEDELEEVESLEEEMGSMYEEDFAEAQFLESRQSNINFELPSASRDVATILEDAMSPKLGGSMMDYESTILKPPSPQSNSELDRLYHAGDKSLTIEYNCLKPSIAIVQVSFSVQPIASESADFETVRFNYLKVCSAGMLFENFEGDSEVNMMGFNVHLGMYSKHDPMFFGIQNGIVSEAYRLISSQLVAGPEEDSTTFYATLDEEVYNFRKKNSDQPIMLELLGAKMLTRRKSNANIMEPVITGNGVFGGVLYAEELPFTVWYNCKKSGNAKIGMRMVVGACQVDQSTGTVKSLPEYGTSEVTINWEKQCSVAPQTKWSAETVDSSFLTPQSPISAQQFKSKEVIRRGNPVASFQKNNKKQEMHHLSTDETFLVMRLDSSATRAPMRFDRPRIVGPSGISAVLMDPDEVTDLYEKGALMFELDEMEAETRQQERERESLTTSYDVTSDNSLFLAIAHFCWRSGTYEMSIELQRTSSTNPPITLYWTKECVVKNDAIKVIHSVPLLLLVGMVSILLTSCVFAGRVNRHTQVIENLRKEEKELEFESIPLQEDLDEE